MDRKVAAFGICVAVLAAGAAGRMAYESGSGLEQQEHFPRLFGAAYMTRNNPFLMYFTNPWRKLWKKTEIF